jgi:hypothetical protein
VKSRLQRIGQSLLTLESDFLAGEPRTCRKVFGAVIAITLSIKFLPVFEILSLSLRSLFLFVLVQISVLVPIRRRLPLLIPGISSHFRSVWNSFMVRYIMPVRVFFGKRLLGIRSVVRDDDPSLATNAQIKPEEWMGLCRDWGKKLYLGRGERIGTMGEVGDMIYRLVSGEVTVKVALFIVLLFFQK